jgi:hypothetical protein
LEKERIFWSPRYTVSACGPRAIHQYEEIAAACQVHGVEGANPLRAGKQIRRNPVVVATVPGPSAACNFHARLMTARMWNNNIHRDLPPSPTNA